MTLLFRLLLLTFLESFATTLVERGVYFFAHDRLGFAGTTNLWLALAFGVTYFAGAMASHPLAMRFGEKRLAVFGIVAQLVVHVLLAAWYATPEMAIRHGGLVLFIGSTLLGAFNGLKWPVVESFVSAGLTPARTMRVIGRFNVSWAASVPLGLVAAGPLIASRFAGGIFALAAVMNVAALWLLRPFPARPVHLPHDHPERPPAGQMLRLRALLTASRWQMLVSYSSMWIVAALMPQVFEQLAVPVAWATAMAGLLDVFRLAAFAGLQVYRGWHDRAAPLIGVLLGLPAGFVLVLSAASLPAVLAGELIFGLAAGLTYYMALYYAMVVKNASVDAGGAHEGLIGMGFAVGPALGLAAGAAGRHAALAPLVVAWPFGAYAVGAAPLFAVCAAGAILAAVRMHRAKP